MQGKHSKCAGATSGLSSHFKMGRKSQLSSHMQLPEHKSGGEKESLPEMQTLF